MRAFDAAAELCRLAEAHIGQPVQLRRFDEVDEIATYDGIWACASLLHLAEAQICDALPGYGRRSSRMGCSTSASSSARANAPAATGTLPMRPKIACVDGCSRWWLSRASTAGSPTTSGPSTPSDGSTRWCVASRSRAKTRHRRHHRSLPAHLCGAINHADEIDLAVAFVKTTGLRLLLPDLQAALLPSTERTARPRGCAW